MRFEKYEEQEIAINLRLINVESNDEITLIRRHLK